MAAPLYSYSANVPQGPQTISSTQTPILNNFQAINELLAVNHVSFLDPVNYGKHTYVSLPLQGSAPTTTSSEMAIFAAASTGQYGVDIFYRYPSDGTIVQLTGTGGLSANAAVNGWSYLTDTLLMKWGQTTGLISGANTVSFPTAGGIPPFTTQVYSVQFSRLGSSTTNLNPYPYISAFTPTTFTFNNPGTVMADIQWLAIGV